MSAAQHERPGAPTPEELAATMGLPSAEGVVVSGGQFANFRAGWAVRVMPMSPKAHYFERVNFETARARCGLAEAQVRWLYGPGNHARCSHCERSRA